MTEQPMEIIALLRKREPADPLFEAAADLILDLLTQTAELKRRSSISVEQARRFRSEASHLNGRVESLEGEKKQLSEALKKAILLLKDRSKKDDALEAEKTDNVVLI